MADTQASGSQGPTAESEEKQGSGGAERRRSERIILEEAVHVYGWDEQGKPFLVEAHTEDVSVHGAKLRMKLLVPAGQKLIILNPTTNRDQRADVVRAWANEGEWVEVAVAFPQPEEEADFWHTVAVEPVSVEAADLLFTGNEP